MKSRTRIEAARRRVTCTVLTALAALAVLATPSASSAVVAQESALPAVFRTALPLVVINAPRRIVDERKVSARMKVIAHRGGRLNSASDRGTDFDGPIGIELRGRSSQGFPKKPYSIETRKTSGKNDNVVLLGLPKDEDWILYPSYNDKTLMRSVLAYRAARKLGRYASRTRFVEVVLNGRYHGVYVLMEKPKILKSRVAVRDTDVTGGYLIEATTREKVNDAHFNTPVTGKPIEFSDPGRGKLSAERATYIEDYVGRFERALYSPEFRDPARGWRAYLDAGSAVDFVLLNELFKNQDGFLASTFLHKDVGGKLKLGPVWDFDIAMGNSSYGKSRFLAGWMLDAYPWSSRLYQDPGFVDQLIRRWRAVRGPLVADLQRGIVANAKTLQAAQARNFARWPILGRYVFPNSAVRNTYAAEVAFLRSWLSRRAAWIDANIEGLRP